MLRCWNQTPSLLFLPSILRLCCQLCSLWLPKHQGSSQAVLCSRQSPVCSLQCDYRFYEVRRQIFTTDFFIQRTPDGTGQLYCLYPEVTSIGTFCLGKLLLLPSSRSKRKGKLMSVPRGHIDERDRQRGVWAESDRGRRKR